MEKLILIVIKDFKIGMDHLPFERKSDDLTGQNDPFLWFEGASQEGLASLEPFGLQSAVTVIDGNFEDLSSSVETDICKSDLSRDGLFDSGNRFRNPANCAAVFISSRKKIEQVFDGSQVHFLPEVETPEDPHHGQTKQGGKARNLSSS